MSIGENIKKARGKIKQIELADMLGVDTATISRWENNKNTPNGYMLKKMAKIFNVPVDYLTDSNETYLGLMALSQKVANEDSVLEEPITAGMRNNMYIIKEGDREFCIPNDENGRAIFLDFLHSSFKGIGLTDTPTHIAQQVNNGTNSSYHDSIVNNGTSTITQVGMSEIV